MKVQTEKVGDARVHISVEFLPEKVEEMRKKVEKKLFQNLKIDGFRKGRVPEDIARKHIDPALIKKESAYALIEENYGSILNEAKIQPLGEPKIHIHDGGEKGLRVEIETDTLPSVEKLPDYKKIGKEIPPIDESTLEVSDKEVEDSINVFRKMRYQQEAQKEGKIVSWNAIRDEDLPALDDDYVKELGNFSSVGDFQAKIRENIREEKRLKEEEKRRIELIEKLVAESKIEVPETMIQHELNKMMHELEGNIVMSGISFDDYLKSIGKTRDDYRREWRDQAIKRAKLQIILDEIAKKEGVDVPDEKIEKEVKALMERYKDAGLDENTVRAYVTQVLRNQEVFKVIEGKGEKKEE